MQTRVVELIPQLLDEGFTEELLVVNDDLNNAFIRYERYAAENTSQLRQCSSSSIAFCFFRTYRNAIGFQVRQIEQSADDECSAGKQTAWAVLAWVVKAWNCDVFLIFLLFQSSTASSNLMDMNPQPTPFDQPAVITATSQPAGNTAANQKKSPNRSEQALHNSFNCVATQNSQNWRWSHVQFWSPLLRSVETLPLWHCHYKLA